MANIEWDYTPAESGETERLTFSRAGEVLGELRGDAAELVGAIIKRYQAPVDLMELTRIIRNGFHSPRTCEQVAEEVMRAVRGRVL